MCHLVVFLFQKKPVRSDRIPHVRKRPYAVQIADFHRAGLEARLNLGDLPRESALGKHVAAARPGVREHPRADRF